MARKEQSNLEKLLDEINESNTYDNLIKNLNKILDEAYDRLSEYEYSDLKSDLRNNLMDVFNEGK